MGKVPVPKMPDLREIVFDYMIDSKIGYVVGMVIRPLGIDITIDKDDLIKTSRDEFHQACRHQWEGHWMQWPSTLVISWEVEAMHSLCQSQESPEEDGQRNTR